MAQLEKKLNLAKKDEIPQQFTSAEMTEIKNAISQETANVNIIPYHIYDIDEHVVGEWRQIVDGIKKKKPVYEKTIVGTFTSSSSARGYTNIVDLSTLNIQKFISSNGSITESNGKTKTLNVADSYGYTISYNANTQYLEMLTTGINEPTPYNITFQYTKTTDEWENV